MSLSRLCCVLPVVFKSALLSLVRTGDVNLSIVAASRFTQTIAGGGAAGTSAAFWLRNAFPKEEQLSITLYEKNDYLGGRSTVVPIKGNASVGFMELGASIYVPKNYNLMNATERFGLKRKRLAEESWNGRGLGIWDGNSFLFEESGNSYWDTVKILWRYGYDPIRVSVVYYGQKKRKTEIVPIETFC